MKNKMLRKAHLSETTCRKIIELFSEGLTATQIAVVAKVSRVTINNYVKWIRTHIADYCEAYNRHNGGSEFEISIRNNFTKHNNPAKQLKTGSVFYGLYVIDDKLFTNELPALSNITLSELKQGIFWSRQKKKDALNGFHKYHAIANLDEWCLYRPAPAQLLHATSSDHIGIFWSNTRMRLQKFRGLRKNMLFLHVKESEFRYNFRNENINLIITHLIQTSDGNLTLTKR